MPAGAHGSTWYNHLVLQSSEIILHKVGKVSRTEIHYISKWSWCYYVAINFVYEYFPFVIYFSNIFFIKTFFQHLFCQNFFPKFVFCGLYSRCSPVYRDKADSMYLCYEKYDMQANIAFRLQHTKFSVLRLIPRLWYSYYLMF